MPRNVHMLEPVASEGKTFLIVNHSNGEAVYLSDRVVPFVIWIIVLDARAWVRSIPPSLVEMTRVFGASEWQAFTRIHLWAALPEILAGIRLGMIRALKGVVIGQLLVSIVDFGRLFELYSSRFLMEHFRALPFVLFAFAFALNEGLVWLERRVDYYSASRD